MATKKDLLGLLKGIPEGEEIAFDLWTVEDVFLAADDAEVTINRKQAEQVLKDVHDHRDAEYGISWTVIKDCLWDLTLKGGN